MAPTSSPAISVPRQGNKIVLPSPITLCVEAFLSYARRFFSFIFILGIPTVLLFVLFVGVFGMADAEAARLTPGLLFSPAVFLGVVLFGAFVLLLQAWGGATFFYAVTSENAEPFWISYARSFPKIGSFFWIFTLLYFSLLAGFAFFILPGVYLAVCFAFAFFTLFDGGDKGLHALARSFLYVRGNWFGVFFRLLSAFLAGAALLVSLRFLLVSVLSFGPADIFVNLISWIFLYPLGFLYAFRIFVALRDRKPRVREELLHTQIFALVVLAGLVIFVATPFVTLRGAARFVPAVTEMFDVRQFFAFGFGGGKSLVRSGPRGEELSALQADRDQKRLSDISTLVFVFDGIASRRPNFCEGLYGKAFKSTSVSGGGTNWLPVDLRKEGVEGPIVTNTPRDPVNTSRYHYVFSCSSRGTYEINVRFEDSKNGSRALTDGGSDDAVYEAGSDLSLIP